MLNKKRAIAGFLLSFVFLGCFSYLSYAMQRTLALSPRFFLGSVSVPQEPGSSKFIATPDISAPAFISVRTDLDGKSEVLLSKNSSEPLPVASLTKMMTAALVFDIYNVFDEIVIGKNADSQSGVLVDIKQGEKYPVQTLLQLMLVGSSNRAAYALAEKLGVDQFVDLMNEKAKTLGMSNTSFADPTGLSPENISSAADLAKFTEYILKNYPVIAETSSIKLLHVYGLGDIKNTDLLLEDVPGIVCSKTGFTMEAKGCLLVVTRGPKDSYLINVILGTEDRFAQMKKIIDWSNAVCK